MRHDTGVPVCSASASLTLRWSRAVLLGFVTLLTGTVAHASAGGFLPSASAMALLFAICVVGSASLLGRTASIPLLIGIVAGGQTAVHLLLSLSGGHAGVAPPPSVVGFGDGGFIVSVPWAFLGEELTGHVPMMTAHLVASIGVALWLSVGETALWSVLHSTAVIVLRPLLVARAALLAQPAPTPLVRLRTLIETPVLPAHLPVLARSVVRRGPPALRAA